VVNAANIRSLYAPIQPTVSRLDEDVAYIEFLPHPNLQPYIYCYWQLKTIKPLQHAFNYRVVADGCIDIYFEPGNATESFIMGFCKKFTEFPLENNFEYIGIRFLPTMFPQLFKTNASELSNRYELLANVVPGTAAYIAKHFHKQQRIATVQNLLDKYFIDVVNNTAMDDDARLYEAIDTILKNYGVLNIETDIDTGISARQLRRLFQYYIGDSTKSFCKVVRFQNILRAKPSRQSLRKNKLFFDAGYYDQNHFIKEFKNFYGVTPSKAFGR